MSHSYSIETRCVHGGAHHWEDPTRAISFPIYQTASFAHIEPGHNGSGFDYTRETNPTRQQLEETVSALEEAADTCAFSSGMAAISAVCELFAPGDHIVATEDLYGGSVRLFNEIGAKNGLAFSYTDTADLDAVEALMRPETKAIYIETPSNPTMRVTDIKKAAALAHRHGALLIVDNTFLSPYFQNPLALGADIVLHSGSKFLSGHNDTIAGFVSAKDPDTAARVRRISVTTGGNLAPFDCWLTLRGLKTLAVRMERQQENAKKIAAFLNAHPKVTRVLYPGLEAHPGADVNAAQARGAGSMLSFTVDSKQTAVNALEHVGVITFAESLGGTESLLTWPAAQTHAEVDPETKARLGITDTLLRLSVGLENADDLIEDLKQALS